MKPDNTQETIYVGLDTGLPPYLPYPRFLLKMDISQTAKLLYALLLDRTTLSQRNGVARFYAGHWDTMQAENIGYLFWGGVGTGKSYLAGCIANALMEKEIPVRMTNFAAILNDLAASFEGRNEYISRLCRYPLLILDDFGMERGTEYGLEQVYSVIDSRYRSRRPLIVTTNLTLQQIQNPPDTAHARIYDRLLEMCAPVRFTGGNFRREAAQAKLERLKNLM